MIKKIIVIEEGKVNDKKNFRKKGLNMENEIKNGKEKRFRKNKRK